MDQHFVPLSFTAGPGSLTIEPPSRPADAPPGDYMLFIVDGNGVPSLASFVHLSAGTPPPDTTAPSVAITGPLPGATVSGATVRV